MSEPRLLGGRYQLGEMVGRGGMAQVYRGRDRRLGRQVAVKTLRTDWAGDRTFEERFRREAQSAASLNHPSIVAVYDSGEDELEGVPVPYIVMEYVEGRTLRELLADERRLLPERGLEIVDGVLAALAYSHGRGIVHRDIKPANIMITPERQIKVMDFGIARVLHDASAPMTGTAQVVGTAQYLSPEQARGQQVDARSDLYSLGCVLYEILTGAPPFGGDSPVAIAYQHAREDPTPPSQVDPEVPAWADPLVASALAKDPDQRYDGAAGMRADIQRALDGRYGTVGAAFSAPTQRMDSTTPSGRPTQALPRRGDESEQQPTRRLGGAGEQQPTRRAGREDEQRKRRRWVYAPLVVLLLALAVVGGWSLSSGLGGPERGGAPQQAPTEGGSGQDAGTGGSTGGPPTQQQDTPSPDETGTTGASPTATGQPTSPEPEPTGTTGTTEPTSSPPESTPQTTGAG